MEANKEKKSQRESILVFHKKQPPLFQKGGDNIAKGRNDYTLYNPTSTPLTWSSDLYVQELLNSKGRLEALEAKEQERDLRFHILTIENQGLAKSNKVLKDLVFLLQETL